MSKLVGWLLTWLEGSESILIVGEAELEWMVCSWESESSWGCGVLKVGGLGGRRGGVGTRSGSDIDTRGRNLFETGSGFGC